LSAAAISIVFFGRDVHFDERVVALVVISVLLVIVVLGPLWDALSMIRDERQEKLVAEGKKKEAEEAITKMKEDHEKEIGRVREQVGKEIAALGSKKHVYSGLGEFIGLGNAMLSVKASIPEEAFKREVEDYSNRAYSFVKQNFPGRFSPDAKVDDPAEYLGTWLERLKRLRDEA